MGNTNRFADGKAEGNRPLGRPRHILEDQVKINQIVLYNGVDYILLAQNMGELQAFVKGVQKLQVM
jgi:hypothetical protein